MGAADLCKGIESVWYSAEGLNKSFTDLWQITALGSDPNFLPVANEFAVLHAVEVSGNVPWPYCEYRLSAPSVVHRSSGTKSITKNREVRKYPCRFRIVGHQVEGDSRPGLVIASYLAEQLIKVYGGHPDSEPTALPLDYGNYLQSQLVNEFHVLYDYGLWWVVNYEFFVDVPVAV